LVVTPELEIFVRCERIRLVRSFRWRGLDALGDVGEHFAGSKHTVGIETIVAVFVSVTLSSA